VSLPILKLIGDHYLMGTGLMRQLVLLSIRAF